MKKGIILITIFVIATVLTSKFTFAQSGYQDVVYLKNGSIIRGIIIEQVPNKSLKIQTKDENVFFFKFEEIEKITKELTEKKKSNNESKKNGFTSINETTFYKGTGSYNEFNTIGFQSINGIKFNPNFSLGFGIGINQGIGNAKQSTIMPLFLDFRINFGNELISPYFSGDVGYSVFISGADQDGLMINPNLGIKFAVSSSVSMNFSIGYKLDYYKTSWFNETINSIGFKIGTSF